MSEHTRTVAARAFDRFKEGLATGQWQGFLDLLADDFWFYFPAGKWHGEWRGKAKAAEFFEYVAAISVTIPRTSLGRASVIARPLVISPRLTRATAWTELR